MPHHARVGASVSSHCDDRLDGPGIRPRRAHAATDASRGDAAVDDGYGRLHGGHLTARRIVNAR